MGCDDTHGDRFITDTAAAVEEVRVVVACKGVEPEIYTINASVTTTSKQEWNFVQMP